VSNRFDDIMEKLAAPFEAWEIRTRTVQGRTITYINAATAQERLDKVMGIVNWRPSYKAVDKGIECTIAIFFDDLGWIEKSDVGGYPGMQVRDQATGELVEDEENDVKGAYSDAFKRAASAWGVGRYLRLGTPPAGAPRPREAAAPATSHHQKRRDQWGPTRRADGSPPQTGKALYAWIREQEQRGVEGLLKYLNGWARLQDFPGRMVDWEPGQVAEAFAEACRKMAEYERSDKLQESLS
jgi:hypothetical protein